MNPNNLDKNNDIKKTTKQNDVNDDKFNIEIENLTFEGEANLTLNGNLKNVDENKPRASGNEASTATGGDDQGEQQSETEGQVLDDSHQPGSSDLDMDDLSGESHEPQEENLPSDEQGGGFEDEPESNPGKKLSDSDTGEDKKNQENKEKKEEENKQPEKEEKKDGAKDQENKESSDGDGQQKKDGSDKVNESGENKSDKEKTQEQGTSSKDNQSKNNTTNNTDDKKNAPNKKGDGKKPDGSATGLDNKNKQSANTGQKRNTPNKRSNPKPGNKGNRGSSLKDRARNRAKNYANNAYKNSSLGQKVEQTKDKIDKAKKAAKATKMVAKGTAKTAKAIALAIKAATAAWPVLLVILAVILICALVAIFTPGIKGDANDDKDNYSEVDQKTLEQLNKLFNKYPNADASLALVTVIYPYYDELWGTNVGSMVKGTSELNEETTEEDESDADDDKTDYESEDKVQDDMYLELFQKWRYRNRLKKLLKKLNSGDEEAFFEYLKNDYFSGHGYDDMINKANDKETLKNYIVEDLKIKKSDFINYVGRVYNCHVNMQSAGTVEIDDVIKSGNVLIDVKEENCDSDVNNCASWHDSPISLKEYVKGVTNTEISINEGTSLEKIKTQMIMVKSFVLGRYKSMGWSVSQDENGNYIIPIRSNTNDQDYCDYNVGCSNKRSGNKHGPASDGVKALLDQAYDETINEYIYDVNKNQSYAAYKTNYDKYCVKGSCLITSDFETGLNTGLTYNQILSGAFTNYAFVSYDPQTDTATAQVSGGKVCTEVGGGTGVPDDKFVYYAQTDPRWKDTQFCGRSDGTIGSSGCGVTSMAMVISTLSNTTVTPIDTMNEAYEIGYCGYGIVGTSASYFLDVAHDYELDNVTLTKDTNGKDKALQVLRNGGLIIANVGANSPFTTGGHYIVIRRIASGRTVYVGDPNHAELFNTPYSIDDFIDKGWITNGWWGFTGPKSAEFSTLMGEAGVATGMFINPFDPSNATTVYTDSGNAAYFPKYKSGSCHGAVDIQKNVGTAIHALDGGIVTSVGDFDSNCYGNSECNKGWNSYGIYIIIDHRNGYQTLYAHLNQRTVDVGDTVAKGQQIGLSGNTGNSSGPHIHLELRDVAKYNANGRNAAKCTSGLGLMNVTKYINTGVSYIGGTE